MKKIYKVVSFYCFTSKRKTSIEEFKNTLLNSVQDDITGLVILAEEGINGTICGNEENINIAIKLIKEFFYRKDLNEKISFSKTNVFKRLKIKIKPEIVTMGVNDINPNKNNGIYVDPLEWNQLIEDEKTLVVDTRNHYEIAIGSFTNTINPNTRNFREFPDWVDNNLEKYSDKKYSKIAMFCTGGIRCEKATSLLIKKGFKNVYHLKGGILGYLEKVPFDANLFKGECYVFDERVALDNRLGKGSYSICHACGMPLSKLDKNTKEYIEGVQCKLCINKFTNEDRQRFAERQKQIDKKKEKLILPLNE